VVIKDKTRHDDAAACWIAAAYRDPLGDAALTTLGLAI